MANKREGLPVARSVKGLHPVEALTESAASNESTPVAEVPTHTKGATSKERVVRETRKAPLPPSIPVASSTSTVGTQSRASKQEDDFDDEAELRPPDAPTVGHYRRSFMLDPLTIDLIDELRWKLRCDKSEVVRRAIEGLADEEKIPFPDE
jgi:hypothetical protein